MKFLKYTSWFLLVPLDWITGILAILLTPFVVPFHSEKTGKLPFGFDWMMTFDNPIDGDSGHVKRWAPVIEKHGKLGRYCARVAWLWRNKAYNFAYKVLGREATSEFHWKGNKDAENTANPKNHGTLWMWNDSCWGVFAFIPWLRIGQKQYCLRVYCGWKLKSEVSNPNRIDRAMLSFHINPLRYYIVK